MFKECFRFIIHEQFAMEKLTAKGRSKYLTVNEIRYIQFDFTVWLFFFSELGVII